MRETKLPPIEKKKQTEKSSQLRTQSIDPRDAANKSKRLQ